MGVANITGNLLNDTGLSLSSYLPLTGGTLTGDLTINNGSADGGQLVLASSGFSNWNLDNFSGSLRAYYGASVALSISSSLAATFSSSVTATQFNAALNTSNSQLNTGSIEIQSFTVNNAWIGDNLYYNGGFKARNNGLVSSIYFQTDGIEFISNDTTYTSGQSVTLPIRMKIRNNGRVGIGTDNPQTILHVSTGSRPAIRSDVGLTGITNNYLMLNSQNYNYGVMGVVSATGASNGDVYALGYTASAGTSMTPVLNWTSGGKVMVNTTDTGVNAYLYASANSNQAYPIGSKGIDAVQGLIGFFDNGNNNIGSIFRQNSSVQYNTSSDYRLKEDFKEVKGLEKVSAIKIYDFKWKNYDYRTDGVLAHELAEILPYAVVGEKDSVNEDGTINAQGVDYSKIVPVLVKAIQELNAKVTALENK